MFVYVVTVFNEFEKCQEIFGVFSKYSNARKLVEEYLVESETYDDYNIEQCHIDTIEVSK